MSGKLSGPFSKVEKDSNSGVACFLEAQSCQDISMSGLSGVVTDDGRLVTFGRHISFSASSSHSTLLAADR